MKDDSVYLHHIIDAIEKILEYTNGLDDKEFLTNNLVQDAVIRQLEVIGEAAKLLSNLTKQKLEDIPWKDISGMRDKLIHGYFGVDLGAVWQTVQDDLPKLEKAVKPLLEDSS